MYLLYTSSHSRFITITNEVKRHALIESIKAEPRNFEIAKFVQVAASFVCKVRRELPNENNRDELAATRRRKEYCQCSADSLTHSLTHPPRTRDFVRREDDMAWQAWQAWHDGRKSWEFNAQHLVKDLQVSEGVTMCEECCSSRPRIQISYILRRGRQLMWTKTTQENRSMGAKRLLEKLEHPEEEACLSLLHCISDENTSTRMKRSVKEVIGG
ncbi:unnamed protein product [Hymenolepis diminuta]|uniref:Uncharacterized protein n=1 Tax=Hymenolepis diminuta TaxID=6216 RepID=A0A564YVP5_HYMDI|nr:unnamed protein product [Hymenolepis diminuta]